MKKFKSIQLSPSPDEEKIINDIIADNPIIGRRGSDIIRYLLSRYNRDARSVLVNVSSVEAQDALEIMSERHPGLATDRLILQALLDCTKEGS